MAHEAKLEWTPPNNKPNMLYRESMYHIVPIITPVAKVPPIPIMLPEI